MTTTHRAVLRSHAVRLADLYIRLECWAQGDDPVPQAATSWVARIFHDGDPLAELGFLQAHIDVADMEDAAAGLFGASTADAVCTVPPTHIAAGDLLIVQSQVEVPRADHDLLVSFTVIRAMMTLRAASAHYLFDALSISVADILDASPYPWGGTIRGHRMSDVTALVEELVASSRGGLRLVT